MSKRKLSESNEQSSPPPVASDAKPIILFYDQKKKYGEFSNYWTTEKPIEFQGKLYATAEHAYQALKYDYPGAPAANAAHAEAIRTARTPAIAKALSNPNPSRPLRWKWETEYNQKARKFHESGSRCRPNWENEKDAVMSSVLLCKFSQDAHCKKVLLETGDAKLVEASPTDSYWGSGRDGRGRNRLGQLLELERYLSIQVEKLRK